MGIVERERESMKIVKLTASNVKRLHAVEITPDGSTVVIAGKNAQGKSSVLDSISYALGGQKLIPSEPIRKGEKAADIKIDLGDIIVIRRFRRDPLTCDCGANYPQTVKTEDLLEAVNVGHKKTCTSHKFGDTRSSLVVTTRDGLEYPSPQAVLNKLLGQLTFDPLAFVNAESDKQVETLRRVVNLDTTELDTERASVYAERTVINRQLNAETVKFEGMPRHPKDGDKFASTDDILGKIQHADDIRNEVAAKDQNIRRIEGVIESSNGILKTSQQRIAELEKQLLAERQSVKDVSEVLHRYEHDLKVTTKARNELFATIPDVEKFKTELNGLTEKNARVQQNIAWKEQAARVEDFKKRVSDYTNTLEEIDGAKRKMIESVKYPVEGLGFDFEKNRLMFNDIPFDQASKAEQIRVSVAIGLAINPKLRVLLVKDGSALDSDGMKLIAELAEQANAQFWIERVAENKDGAMVMIEDGTVV
jgi:energy-coupling factor transporter ATP-binding protein EcfA2